MNRRTVAWEAMPDVGNASPKYGDETGWRAFLGSWKWAAILFAGCVGGLVAMFLANPFASASVSERISARLSQPAACVEIGAAQVADEQSTIYRCTVGSDRQGLTQCFAISGHDINQFIGNRKVRC